MKAAPPKHWHTWGLILAGDFADITFWHTKRKKTPIAIAKTWPKKPPSEAQKEHRQKFQTALKEWLSLTKDQRAAYQTAAERLSLTMTGINLFLALRLSPDPSTKQTIERQAQVNLA